MEKSLGGFACVKIVTKKLTKQEVLANLEARNKNNAENPAFLDPIDQQYCGQSKPLRFRCKHNHTWYGTYTNTIYQNRGCPTCRRLKEHMTKRTPWSAIMCEFAKLPTSYTYDEQSYVNATSYMTARCPNHGDFQIIPNKHIQGKYKCPTCNVLEQRAQKQGEFINTASKVHNNFYNYDEVEYINSNTKVIIKCPIHGQFAQQPTTHLNHGCPQCTNNRISKKQIYWLQCLAKTHGVVIQHALNGGEFMIPGTRWKVDGFDQTTNTIYEFYGDAFHGNLSRYQSTEHCHPYTNETALDLNRKTMDREAQIRRLGFNVVSIWESDFDASFPQFSKMNTVTHGAYYKHQIPTSELVELNLTLVDSEFKGFKCNHNFKCNDCQTHFVSTLTYLKQRAKNRQTKTCCKQTHRGIEVIHE